MNNPLNKHKDMISFIIPAMNEEATIETLIAGIEKEMKILTNHWEVLLIDDGSTDRTWRVMKRMENRYPSIVRAFQFRCNRGKADALALGYREVKGDIIFTMDADLQDDPKEIPRFIQAIYDGADIVTGWKRKRHDPWHKVLPSRLFNAVISKLTGVQLHDHNCGFKAYRKEVVKSLPMYGDMHRMVPSLASFKGYKTSELVVEHHPRLHGVSKYGWGRMLIGLMDTATVCFLQKYRNCPMHLMGNVALVAGLIAGASFIFSIVVMSMNPALAMLLFITGMTMLAISTLVGMQGLVLEHRVHEKMQPERSLPVVQNEDSNTVIQFTLEKPSRLPHGDSGVTLSQAL